MHGEILRALCAACGARWDAPEAKWTPPTPAPPAPPPPPRPMVVWFGEGPYHMDRIAEAIGTADLFAAIGTSGEVYPAAGFAAGARRAGAETVEINLEPTKGPFQRRITGPASEDRARLGGRRSAQAAPERHRPLS